MRRILVYLVVAVVVLAVVQAVGDAPAGTSAAPDARTPRAQPTSPPPATAVMPSASESQGITPSSEPSPSPTAVPPQQSGMAPTGPIQVATVASITDGDTIRVLLDGQNVPVRYIGIDTPEIHGKVEPGGPEAADANARLVAGREVVLEKDVSETDRYGRLLRHVWLHDAGGWTLVSLELLRLGMAQVTTYPPDVKYVDDLFLPAQRAAREAGVGLWGAGFAAESPSTILPLVPGGADCEPSYPSICVPIGSPDLDCGDIAARHFEVRWDVPRPDPHGFDGNRDGVGCEF